MTSNLVPLVERLAEATAEADDTSTQDTIELLKPLLASETLTVLQLLGFNFKQAIGEPLTVLVGALILAQVPRQSSERDDAAMVTQQQTLEALRLAQDPDAFARYQVFHGG